MSDDVDTRISPTIHAEIIAAIEEYDDDTRPLLGSAETLFDTAHKALQSIHNAKEGAALNPSLNAFEQLVAVDDHAGKVMAPVLKSWDRVSEALNNNIAQIERELNAPIELKASQGMAAEICSYFAGLKPGERLTAIQNAIHEGDERTVSSICGAPGYLSGLEPEVQASFLTEWNEKQKPLEAKKVRAMKKARDLLDRNAGVLKHQWKKAVGVHEEFAEDAQGRRLLMRTWTASEIRARVKASNERFAVPV